MGGHYLNTLQSEIEFRAPSPVSPPTHSLPGLLFLLVQLGRSRIPFSPYCSSEPSGILCSSSTLKLNQPQFDLFMYHNLLQIYSMYTQATFGTCVCARAPSSVCVCAPICAPVSARIACSEVGNSISPFAAE